MKFVPFLAIFPAVVLLVVLACGTPEAPPAPQDRTLEDVQREAYEQKIRELEAQVDASPETASASPVRQQRSGECVAWVFDDFCLGGGEDLLPPDPHAVDQGRWKYDVHEALVQDGQVVFVGASLGNLGWVEIRQLERELTTSFGPPDLDGTTLPTDASDAHTQVLLKTGQAVYSRLWVTDRYSVRLWAAGDIVAKNYFLPDGHDYARQVFDEGWESVRAIEGGATPLLDDWAEAEPDPGSPTPQAASSDLHVTSAFKTVERNDSWWRFSWQINLRNQGERRLALKVRAEFLDAEGFVVGQSYPKNVTVEPGQALTVRDRLLIRCPGCRTVLNLQPVVEF